MTGRIIEADMQPCWDNGRPGRPTDDVPGEIIHSTHSLVAVESDTESDC